jgi:phosphatidylinositol-3-phosphatase
MSAAATRLGRSVVLLAAAVVASMLVATALPTDRDPVAGAARASLGAARASLKRVVPRFVHAIVVVFENHSARRILGVVDSPFRRLGHRYALLARYDAVAHPSLPNYLALVSGSTFGLHHDCTDCLVQGRSLADTLGKRSLSWKTYAEHLPLYLSQGARITGPEKARLPFLYFSDLRTRALRSTVPLDRFFRDLRSGMLPAFSLVIPDLCHDMHSCSIADGDRWLRGFMAPLLRPGALAHSVLFLVFDEGRWSDRRGGGGRVAAVVVGPLVRPHSVSYAPLSHYSLLRTIEDAWKLPPLGRSGSARPITGIWR